MWPLRTALNERTCSRRVSTARPSGASSANCTRRGQSRASAARKLAAVRTFLKYLRREELIADDPGSLVPTPKRDIRMPAHLSEGEMDALLDAPADTPLGRRDRAILELFYASGLRLSELVGLDLDDVNLGAKMVRVLGKGGKERIVPFNNSAAKMIRAYLPDRALLVGNSRPPRRSGPTACVERRAFFLAVTRSPPALCQLPRHENHRPQRGSPGPPPRRRQQLALGPQPARDPALVCHPSAAARRGSSRHSGVARPCAPEHDAAIHARQCRAVARGVPEVAPAGEVVGLVACPCRSRTTGILRRSALALRKSVSQG